jgi:hypothetical protein
LTDALKRKCGRHGGHGAACIEGRAERERDKAESWGEKSREREDAKKGKFGGQGERDDGDSLRGNERWPVRRKLPSGVVAGSAGYQSKSNPSHLRLPHGKSHFTSASKGGWPPNSLRRINESGKPQLGPPLNDYFKEDWKGRGYETGASVARSRVFVITGLALAQCLETLFLRKTLDCEKSGLHINTYTISMHSLRSASFLSPPFVPFIFCTATNLRILLRISDL